MGVFEALVEAYAAEGMQTSSGLNPTLTMDYFLAPFTWLVRDGESVTDGLGISVQEIYFLECLAQARRAQRILVVGNAYGWSTLALAMANPGAEVVAIDAGYDHNSLAGLDVTTRMAGQLGLPVRTVRAVSPQDVAPVVTDTLGQVDLAFVDGFHSCEQIVQDWRAVRPFLSASAVVLFHDVLFVDLLPGFRRIVAESGWTGTVLHATTTGMALLAQEYDAALTRLTTAFAGHDGARDLVMTQALQLAHQRGASQRADALRAIPPDHDAGDEVAVRARHRVLHERER